ncbi:hypothetical protein CEXT_314781 [Caerostris extrusa]|uniref:Uncharacterized protein n=1 Tax=Caerostris extrusa TaxID=172846 RepID=A0AAV4NU23_CAEEX|nr:hypothetical protein CEXT_314781 [Caerostris extrusa]
MAFTAQAKKDSWLSLHSKGSVAFTVLAKKKDPWTSLHCQKESVTYTVLSERIQCLHCTGKKRSEVFTVLAKRIRGFHCTGKNRSVIFTELAKKDPRPSLKWQKFRGLHCICKEKSSFPFSTSLVLLCTSGKFVPPPGSGLLPWEVSRAPEGWHRSRARLRIGRALIPADDSPRAFRDRLRTDVLH